MKKFLIPLFSLFSAAAVLLAVVDFRRGFLFDKTFYTYKSMFCVFSIWQIFLLAAGICGLYLSSLYFKKHKKSESINSFFLIGIFVILMLDFILYRGISFSRVLDSGKINLDWLKNNSSKDFTQPLELSFSYLLTVWHATMLSCLVAGLFFMALPKIKNKIKNYTNFKATVAGAVVACTQPLCSCCSVLILPAFIKNEMSMSFMLAFVLGAPLLNVTTLTLAFILLPLKYAVLRLLGGLFMTLILSYGLVRYLNLNHESIAILTDKVNSKSKLFHFLQKYLKINFENDVHQSNFFKTWFSLSFKVAIMLIPSMIFGTILTSGVWYFWPTELNNSIFAVFLISVLGTLVMISTWSEIPIALQFIATGLTGPAAAALISLPGINLSSLILIGKITSKWKTVTAIFLAIVTFSFLIGISFI